MFSPRINPHYDSLLSFVRDQISQLHSVAIGNHSQGAV
jgi:hypothetical protein